MLRVPIGLGMRRHLNGTIIFLGDLADRRWCVARLGHAGNSIFTD